MQAAVKAFENHDIVYLHVKAADILAHDRKPKEKMEFLQRLDQVLKPVLDRGHLVAIVAEHTTDSNTGWHTNDALPALIYSPTHGATILGENFGETSCLNGTMRYHTGASFMQATLDEIAGLNKRRAQLA
jgi:2,3-bisphosphoglycerate-independent phosphoglycerate mutase